MRQKSRREFCMDKNKHPKHVVLKVCLPDSTFNFICMILDHL